MNVRWKVLVGLWVCVMLVTGLLSSLHADRAALSASVAPESPTQVESLGGPPRPAVLRLAPATSTLRIPPPSSYTQLAPLKVQTATIDVTYLQEGDHDGFDLGLDCQTWPAEAITAFEYAASIWETLMISTIPIKISACWADLGDPGILGIGGADGYYSNFAGAPLANTLYPTALANALAGTRMHGSTVDIHVAYGSTFAWYFGTDGSTPLDKVDFASVVLHEICHGLGFAGSMIVRSGLGYWGWDYYPISVAYDHFAENGAGTDLLSYTNGSAALAAQLLSGNLYFNGTHANTANGGQRPKLFAPATWMQGSSYSHLDEIFNGTADDLMTYAIPNGQSMHAPGPIALGMLSDIGWPLPTQNTAPALSGLPDQALAPGAAKDNAIDLWTYAVDVQDIDADLTFTITNALPADAGVEIDSNRYIDINPVAGYLGIVPVTVEVMDTGGLTDTDTFSITFAEVVNTPPVLSSLPDQTLEPGETKDNAIDLWAYASDDSDADDALLFSLTGVVPITVGVTIDGERYIDITPTESFTGTFPVVVEVQDTGGLTDTDTFTITFAEIETRYVYLPLVLRRHPLPPELPTVIIAIEDTDIAQAYPDINDGASTSMLAGYDDYFDPDWQILRSLIKFDVSAIPANTPISSAVLRVRYNWFWDYEGYIRNVTSYRISSSWSENTVTWNTAPTIGEAYGSVALVASDAALGWYSIDVTNLVRGWVNGTWSNYGIMLRGPEHSGSDSSWRGFGTKEADNAPELHITYTGMAATGVELGRVVPAIVYTPSNGIQLPRMLGSASQDTLCDLFGCITP